VGAEVAEVAGVVVSNVVVASIAGPAWLAWWWAVVAEVAGVVVVAEMGSRGRQLRGGGPR
jgi:hypothetical protein